MDTNKFDEIYDAEIERISKSLPNPETFPMPTITCPVDLGEINFLKQIANPIDFYKERENKIVQHTIEFRKVFKGGKWCWERS